MSEASKAPVFEPAPAQTLVSRDGSERHEFENLCAACGGQRPCDKATGYCRSCWRAAVLTPWALGRSEPKVP